MTSKLTILALVGAIAATAPLVGVSVVHAQSTVRPLAGTEVGLEHEPERLVAPRTTDRSGNVVFVGLAPGRYAVFLPDGSRLQTPVRIGVSAGIPTPEGDYSIQPGRGRAYAVDSNGRRLVVTIPRAGGRISVNVSSIFDRWGRQGEPGA